MGSATEFHDYSRSLTPEQCLQRAADLLFKENGEAPTQSETQLAQVLVSLGRELRIGGVSKRYQGYGTVEAHRHVPVHVHTPGGTEVADASDAGDAGADADVTGDGTPASV